MITQSFIVRLGIFFYIILVIIFFLFLLFLLFCFCGITIVFFFTLSPRVDNPHDDNDNIFYLSIGRIKLYNYCELLFFYIHFII